MSIAAETTELAFSHRHLLGIEGLSRGEIISLLDMSEAAATLSRQVAKKRDDLGGRTLINLFFEASTRTQSSFELAGKRLGADVMNMSVGTSSVQKGETLIDTAVTLNAMRPDILVVRHYAAGAVELLAQKVDCSVINAGDGSHEHPTQALLDALTIRRHKGRISGLIVAICGDILHSRVARSNILLLNALGARVRVVAPSTLLAPGIEQYLSGVILYQETLNQKGSDKKLFSKSLAERGIIPGIKVDEGTEPFPESPDELITKGVIGLCDRLSEFHTTYHTGFTKWRAVVRIEGDRLPTAQALVENSKRLAVYARDVQEVSMVPIIEPEVLYAGTHSRLRARQVQEATLTTVFDALRDQAVDLSAVILKTSMVLSGSESGRTDTPEEVAEDTLAALMATVPAKLAGIVFLSGGQTPDQATENLRAIGKLAREKGAPWPVTFSFARALQSEALLLWKGKDANVEVAREAFIARLAKVSEALNG